MHRAHEHTADGLSEKRFKILSRWRLFAHAATYTILLIAGLVMPCSAATQPTTRPVEGRGIWIDANSIPTDDKAMAAFVDELNKMHMNVLFPETLRRGYTIYPSKLDTQDPKFKGYDPLAALIREAHARGMEVHPWVWVFRQGYSKDKGPILTEHPEWLAVNKWGESLSANGGYWICPSIPEARNYLISIFSEISKNYDIDGLHLDYIRYENQFPAAYCYNTSCREKYKAQCGVDPMEIQPLTEQFVSWGLWREDLVNSFVQNVAQNVRAINPKIKISAAVGSFPDQARISLLQNWVNWVDNKWVDFLAPMDYTANTDTFRNMVTTELLAVGDKTIVMPGLGLHVHKTPQTTVDQVYEADNLGADGVTLFASAHLKAETVKALSEGPFAGCAQVPFRNTSDAVKTLLDSAKGLVDSNPQLAASYLRESTHLLGYISYHSADIGYVAPTRPPITVPENVLPLPTVEVPRAATEPVIDGCLNEPMWAAAAKLYIEHTEMGKPAPVATEVRLAYDDRNLYIAYSATETSMSAIKATVEKRDGPVFYDDSAEFFLDPWGKRQQYYQLAVNTLGTQFDAKLNDSGANLAWKAVSTRSDSGWVMEIAVPYSSLGVTTPQTGSVWNANFARNRWITGSAEYLVWSVPYGSFNQPERFGTLIFK